MSQIDDHARRVLRAEFAAGLVDHPTQKSVVDVLGGLETAQRIEENSIVLLKNEHNILPLDPAKVHSIAVLGLNADTGMISGGGSAQVDPPGRPSAPWQSACVVSHIAAEGDRREGARRDGALRRQRACGSRGGSERRGCRDRLRVPVGERRHGPAGSFAAGQSGCADRAGGRGESAYHRRAGDGNRRDHAMAG